MVTLCSFLRSPASPTSTASAASEKNVSLKVHRLDGLELPISVDASCSIADLSNTVHAALGLAKCQNITLSFGMMALESADRDATLQTVGIQGGDELGVVILREIRVLRHVYRAGGGAPPWRSGSLVSTEEVYLDPSLPLCEQWTKLAPEADDVHLMTTRADTECSYCGGKGSGGSSRRDRCENCDGHGRIQGAPKLWGEADKEENPLRSRERRPAWEVFEKHNAIGIVLRMRGMD